MPIPIVPTNTHSPVCRRSAYFAMNSEPTTNPIDVRPSWIPYSNSVAPSSWIAIGSRSTFHRPNAKYTGAPSRNSERSIGMSRIDRMPTLRLVTTTPTDVSSSAPPGFERTLSR